MYNPIVLLEKIKKFVWEYKKLLIVAFVAGLFMPQLYTPSLQSSLIDYNQFDSEKNPTEAAIIAYHVEMNDLVNEYIELLLDEENPSVLYVEDAADCGSGNASTYCLAVELNEELLALQLYLDEHLDDVVTSGTLKSEEDGEDVSDESEIDYSTLEDVIAASVQQKTMILDEMEAAEDTLDLMLAVYNQLQMVYPIHKALNGDDDSLMKALENLNNALADVRKETQYFPAKFNDATMVECK